MQKQTGREYDLLIYIPTYNRAEKLRNSLQIIAGQISGLESRVRIFVSNNGSTDSTKKILENLNVNWLDYISHASNRGMFLNIISAYDLPIIAKFVWIIGDDDYLLPDAIKDLLQQIEEYPNVDLIFCNTTAFPSTNHDEIMGLYLETGQIGEGSIKSNIFKGVEVVAFEKLVDPRIADTLLGELMVLCFRQEKFYFSYEKSLQLNTKLQAISKEEHCTLAEQGMFRQPHNVGLFENINASTMSLYHPKPKTFNFWGAATEWLKDYDYVFPVIILFLIKEYKSKNIINNEKYLFLLNYYFKLMQNSFYRQLSDTSTAIKFPDKIKGEFFDAIFELCLAKGLFK